MGSPRRSPSQEPFLLTQPHPPLCPPPHPRPKDLRSPACPLLSGSVPCPPRPSTLVLGADSLLQPPGQPQPCTARSPGPRPVPLLTPQGVPDPGRATGRGMTGNVPEVLTGCCAHLAHELASSRNADGPGLALARGGLWGQQAQTRSPCGPC